MSSNVQGTFQVCHAYIKGSAPIRPDAEREDVLGVHINDRLLSVLCGG